MQSEEWRELLANAAELVRGQTAVPGLRAVPRTDRKPAVAFLVMVAEPPGDAGCCPSPKGRTRCVAANA